MQDTKLAHTLKWWPSPQDYNEAIQNPHVNLQDAELKSGVVYVDSLDIPRPVTGAFASVYRVHCSSGDRAVRCFLRDVADAETRYSLISEFVQHDDLISTVTFDYLRTGIRVNGQSFPILKMEWVEGQTLEHYIESILRSNIALEHLAEKFKTMCKDLYRAGIAHGDLQHGNIMVRNNELVLVDYDGMYVPSMRGFTSNELGHRNYQHPNRTEEHFGHYLDNFSAWMIYTSLKAIAIDPQLYKRLQSGDDCLLFRCEDFLHPTNSCAFAALEGHDCEELRILARFIRWQLKNPPDKVPHIGADLSGIPGLEPLSSSISTVRPPGSSIASSLPEWLNSSLVAIDSSDDAIKVARAKSNAGSVSGQQTRFQQWTLQPFTTKQNSGVAAHTEAELLKPAPRHVQFNSAAGTPPERYQFLMLLNPLVWVLVFHMLVIIPNDFDLRDHGIDCPGKVENIERVTRNKGSDTYNITYSYSTHFNPFDHNNPGTNTADVSLEKGAALRVGSPVTVRVLKDKPSVHSPNFLPELGPNASELPGKINSDLLTCLSLIIVNTVLEVFIWLIPLKHKRLARKGMPTVGKIIRYDEEADPNGRTSYYLCYEYEDQRGRRHVSRLGVGVSDRIKLAVSQPITILYAPNRPAESVPYMFCRYKAL